MRSYTDPPAEILDYLSYYTGHEAGDSRQLQLAEGRQQGSSILARFESCGDRNTAEELAGTVLYIDSSRLPQLAEGEYYWAELIGLQVVTSAGVSLGQVIRMMETGANDVLVVSGDRERLIPYVAGVVVEQVDLAQSALVVNWDPEF